MKIGKTETGKLYHIVNIMDYGDSFSICGCYLPKDKQFSCDNVFKLNDEKQMCEKCMYSRFYMQSRD